MDRFKTQVLFLHSEPSTMTPCANQLGEEFSVHMAASGTEALTTLGITPIHVIVCAEDLPGMSGQDALKEARKRSPETRGILLASKRMTTADRAALVNAAHLQQILENNATPAQICNAIMEVLGKVTPVAGSLPLPANDHSAGPQSGMQVAATMQDSGSFLHDDIPILKPREQSGNQHSQASLSQVQILVLTNDTSFLNTVRAATGSSHVVNHAPNLQEAIDIVQSGTSGVLVTDAAVAVKDVQTITSKLRKHLPSLVTVVAGRREDGERMMDLISDGLVYRFLLKPISPGRTRLAIEASAKKHLTLAGTEVPLSPEEVQRKMSETGVFKPGVFDSGLFRTTSIRETDIRDTLHADTRVSMAGTITNTIARRPLAWIGGFSLVIAIAAIAFTLIGKAGSDAQPTTDTTSSQAQPNPVSARPTTAPEPSANELIARLMTQAQRAVADGRVLEPRGNNAIAFLSRGLAIKGDHVELNRAFASVVDDSFAIIGRAIDAGDLQSASEAMEILKSAAPNHPRINEFDARLSVAKRQDVYERAEQAIYDSDATNAGRLVSEFTAMGGSTTKLASLQAGLDALNLNQTTPQLLQLATQRVAEGQLATPSNDSARFYYEKVLEQDPENAIARQGMVFVGNLLVANAKTAIANGDYASARQDLATALASGAPSENIEPLLNSISSLEKAQGEALAARQAPVEKSVDTSADIAASDEKIAEPTAAASKGTAENIDNTVAKSQPASQSVTQKATPAVSAEQLRQINYAAPRYPRAAQRRGVEGWADVQFTVLADGSVGEISVADSQPNDVFDKAAIEAVSQWRYEPLSLTDENLQTRARVRLEFNLQD